MLNLGTLTLMILAGVFSRLIPHPWNFTAIGAVALFGGAYFASKRMSLLVPLVSLVLSDLVLGFHSTMIYVYLSFALTVILGWSLREKISISRLASSSVLSSGLFFVITNFGVWLSSGFYSHNFEGLVTCFVLAIPFLDNQILGDLFYSAILFGAYELLKQQLPLSSATTK